MSDSPIKDKSYKFAIRIVKLYKHLTEEKHEYVLSKEVLRAGTEIGAHVREAANGVSRTDFIQQMALALRYNSRAEYWLELLRDSDYLTPAAFDSMHKDSKELEKLLTSIVKTSRQS